MDSNAKWNIILVGQPAVGKTSMIVRYVDNYFISKVQATVAVDIFNKNIQVHQKDIVLDIWDSVGQECYKSIVPMYFRRADGCILVYDVTDVTTFNALSGWLSEFRDINVTAPVIIVGNKSEDPNRKAVAQRVVREYAEQEDMEYMECSAMTGTNVESVFEALIEKIWINKMALDAAKQNSEQNEQEQNSNMHSLGASLSHKSERNSIILTELDLEDNTKQQQSESLCVDQDTKTVTKKGKCC